MKIIDEEKKNWWFHTLFIIKALQSIEFVHIQRSTDNTESATMKYFQSRTNDGVEKERKKIKNHLAEFSEQQNENLIWNMDELFTRQQQLNRTTSPRNYLIETKYHKTKQHGTRENTIVYCTNISNGKKIKGVGGLYVNESVHKKSSIKNHPFHLTDDTSCRNISILQWTYFFHYLLLAHFMFPFAFVLLFVSHSTQSKSLLFRSHSNIRTFETKAKVFVSKAHDFCCSLRSVYPDAHPSLFTRKRSQFIRHLFPQSMFIVCSIPFFSHVFRFTKECRHNFFSPIARSHDYSIECENECKNECDDNPSTINSVHPCWSTASRTRSLCSCWFRIKWQKRMEFGFSKVFDIISSIVHIVYSGTPNTRTIHTKNFVRFYSFNLCMLSAVTYVPSSNFPSKGYNIIEWSFSKMWIIFRLENQNGIPFDEFYWIHCINILYLQQLCVWSFIFKAYAYASKRIDNARIFFGKEKKNK